MPVKYKSDDELIEAIKKLKSANLTEGDKKDLLSVFQLTQNASIANQIALIFSDARYNEAIPFVIKKINEEESYNRNGTLVYSLENLDSQSYFIDLIEIICKQGYEARVMAYSIVEKFVKSISTEVKNQSLELLEIYRLKQPVVDDADYENSTLHFIEATQRLLMVC
ncbi:hypothetical protein ACFQZI_12465 [Mucilaginibacter lutimaris]|uniref:HEAT repeat domain-containing protein n=1 Tax=Mucilaginibacter lutimaris TaxID=931629 RepID=A0ABW2ZHU3_9SPHI